jgi:hypothetical protein
MSLHVLANRSERELSWPHRRSFLQAAASWTALGGFAQAQAQQRSNVVERRGDFLINGRPMAPQQSILSGDTMQSGPDSNMVFVVGNASFLVRQNSYLTVERGATLNTISVLRLLVGAVASVWGPGRRRQIVTPTLTAGIRGTGIYTEVFKAQNDRSYLCNCYGVVELDASGEQMRSEAQYHQSFYADATAQGGRRLTPAGAINHSDEEIENLARLVDQRTAWQIAGRRGVKDGRGFMEPGPGQAHPAAPPGR